MVFIMSTPKILLSNAQLLKESNYAAWNTKMKTILQFYYLWEIVSRATTCANDVNKKKKFDKASTKALMLITNSITDEVKPYVQDITTSKSAWDVLSTIY